MDKKPILTRFNDYDYYGHLSSAAAVHLSIQERLNDFCEEIKLCEKDEIKFIAKKISIDFKKECKIFLDIFKKIEIKNISPFSFNIMYVFFSSENEVFFEVDTKMCFISKESKLVGMPKYFLDKVQDFRKF